MTVAVAGEGPGTIEVIGYLGDGRSFLVPTPSDPILCIQEKNNPLNLDENWLTPVVALCWTSGDGTPQPELSPGSTLTHQITH